MANSVEYNYTPATVIVRDSNGPVSGSSLFRDVPYGFSRHLDSIPFGIDPHEWFDLIPEDPNLGLEMMAVGRFRDDHAVWWNSFGSPALNNQSDIRPMFIEFLNRLCLETATWAHCDAFCVAHYADDDLECARQDCVRLFLDRESLDLLNDNERDTLKGLAETLQKNVG